MLLSKAAPTLRKQKHSVIMKIQSILNVCERLFDELVKEWLKSRYTIVSGTFREIDGRRTPQKVHICLLISISANVKQPILSTGCSRPADRQHTTGRRRAGLCGGVWRGGSRSRTRVGWCRRRLRGHRRAASGLAVYGNRSRSRRGGCRRLPVLPGGWLRNPAGSRDCCCLCYRLCMGARGGRLRRCAFRGRAASLSPLLPLCRLCR